MLWLWLIACDVTLYANLPPATDAGGVDTADDTALPTGTPPDAYEGPTLIDTWSVACPKGDQGTLALDIQTRGWTNGIARVYLIETADDTTPWDEEHPVQSVERDPLGYFERHFIGLTDQATYGSWAPGEATRFACELDVNPDRLTWVVRAYDTAGLLADCVASGHDPWGVVLGAYHDIAAHRGPEEPDEFAACTVVTD